MSLVGSEVGRGLVGGGDVLRTAHGHGIAREQPLRAAFPGPSVHSAATRFLQILHVPSFRPDNPFVLT